MKTIKLSIAIFILMGVQQGVNAQNRKMETRVETEPKIKEVERTEVAPVKDPEIKAEPRIEIATPSQPIEHAEFTPAKEPEIKAEPRQPEVVKPVAARKPMPVYQRGKLPPMRREMAIKPTFIDPAKK